MELLKQYLIPNIISITISILCIAGALRKPIWTRFFLAALFLWASYINTKTAINAPGEYLNYSRLTYMRLYKEFIDGFFSQHIRQIVIPIAVCQFLISVGLQLNKLWTKLACVGGIIFDLAIVPLGVGSAFPATLLVAVAFYILLTRYEHDYIWKLNQYETTRKFSKKISYRREKK
ncbi:MAG: hypothetical protein JST75_21830 [Bacteroidetes bacterium]|nr:hypothetical protein [Bacteroidota bacterium]